MSSISDAVSWRTMLSSIAITCSSGMLRLQDGGEGGCGEGRAGLYSAPVLTPARADPHRRFPSHPGHEGGFAKRGTFAEDDRRHLQVLAGSAAHLRG